MEFMQFHDKDGEPVLINLDKIWLIRPSVHGKHCLLIFGGGDKDFISLQETFGEVAQTVGVNFPDQPKNSA